MTMRCERMCQHQRKFSKKKDSHSYAHILSMCVALMVMCVQALFNRIHMQFYLNIQNISFLLVKIGFQYKNVFVESNIDGKTTRLITLPPASWVLCPTSPN